MARGFPSMTALLGLLAIAGYQNRDKLGELLGGGGAAGRTGLPGGAAGGTAGGLGGLLGGLGGGAGAAGAGGLISGGLKELVDSFRQAGQGDKVEFLGSHGRQQAVQSGGSQARDRPRHDGDTSPSRPAFRKTN